MSDLTVLYPVRTLNNQLLLPAGTALSAETLNALVSSSRSVSYQTYSLLRYGLVKKDLLHVFSLPPYKTIFANQNKTTETLNLMEGVHLALPVLQSLDYFKQYDFFTYRHSLIVFALSVLLAKILQTDYNELVHETVAGPTHDFGKTCTPLHILKKQKPLTRTEHNVLKHHTIAGYVLLSYYLQDSKSITAKLARDHHERKDGSGYPQGIRQKDRLVEIVAVSDVYDALISPRPYRPASYDNRTALEEITNMAERNEVGWEVVNALIACNRKDRPYYGGIRVSTEKRGAPPADSVYGVIVDDKGSNNADDD